MPENLKLMGLIDVLGRRAGADRRELRVAGLTEERRRSADRRQGMDRRSWLDRRNGDRRQKVIPRAPIDRRAGDERRTDLDRRGSLIFNVAS
ncbi:hypothetical protein ACFL9T_18215 [Thermodesulfobacteriota bacterium]